MVWTMIALVVKMTTICTLIAITSVRQWCISQLDVKNVFLNGDLQEEDYLEPLLVFLMIMGMFASLERHYMVSNKHLVLSLRHFLL